MSLLSFTSSLIASVQVPYGICHAVSDFIRLDVMSGDCLDDSARVSVIRFIRAT
jgi:hypothetical protein